MKVAVCPHDSSKNWSKWLNFFLYLSKKTGENLSPILSPNFEHYWSIFPTIDLAYSNPIDSLALEEKRGFLPVAGNDNYDEVVIFTKKGGSGEISGKKVGCVKDQFATFLGIKILRDMGVSGIDVKYYDSWQSVVSGVVKGEVDVGFLYKDFYDQLSNLSRREIEVLHVSKSGLFSHLFMVSPERKELRDKLLGALLELDEEGKKLAEDLGIRRFYEVSSLEELRRFVGESKAILSSH